MRTIIPQHLTTFGSRVARGVALSAAAVFLMGSNAVFAAPAPANQAIGNQASASYLDPNGNQQISSSNSVQTTVMQVGAFVLDAKSTTATPYDVANSKSGAAGAVIYAPHVLTNTGNGSDTFNITVTGSTKFTKVEIYNDSNFDGQPDSATPLCVSVLNGAQGCATPVSQTVAGSNAQYGFVVAYTIAATATGTPGDYDFGNVTVAPQSTNIALYDAANQSVTVQDKVSLTTSAAFNVSKSISQPANGIAPPSGSWPAAINNGKRTPATASCATTWSGVASASASCVYTTFTITYSNTGAAAGRFNLQDVIGSGATAGFTYVTGSAVWSSQPGAALSETSGSNGANVDMAWNSGSSTLTFVDNAVPVNTTRSLTFVVLVNSTAAIGTSSTSNAVNYNPADASGATASAPVSVSAAKSNTAPFTVLGTYSIAVGSQSSATSSDAKDATAGTPGTGSGDTNTLAAVAAGKPAVFVHKIYNLGNDTDSVNLAVTNAPVGGFPAGTVFRLYTVDGTTELADSNNDGKIDTGPIAAGSSVQVVVKAFMPSTTGVNAAANYKLTLSGTSGSDSTQIDASADTLVAVTGPFIDMTNTPSGKGDGSSSDDVGTGPSTAATLTATGTNAGSWTGFNLYLKNNDSAANTFNLSASATTAFPGSLPAGWVVKFIFGPPSSCSTATAVSTVSIGAGVQAGVAACVFVPLTQGAITQSLYFQAKAANAASDGTYPADVIHDAVEVVAAALTYSATLTPNGVNSVIAGGSVTFAHVLTATGTGSCSAGSATVSIPGADTTAGWTTALYLDVNQNGILDAGDTLITDGAVPAATPTQPVYLLVKVFAPAGASAGKSTTATVAVTFPAGATNCGTPSATGTATVVVGQVQLVTVQAKTDCSAAAADGVVAANGFTGAQIQAKPGDCVLYKVTATNNGTSAVTNLTLSNTLPSYTKLATAQPSSTCSSTGVTPAFNTGTTWAAGSTSVSCGGVNTMQPGATASMTFQVQLNK